MTLSRCCAALALAPLLLSGACAPDGVIAARDLDEMELTMGLSTSVVPEDDTASVTLRVTNRGRQAIRFASQSRCQLTFRIRDVATDQYVFAGADGWQCAGVLTDATVAGGSSRSVAVTLHGVSPMPGHLHGVHLERGEYEVEARLATPHASIDAPAVRFAAR